MRKLACCLMVVALAACADKSKGPNLSGGDPSDGVDAAGAGGESSRTSASGGEPTAGGGAAGGPLEPAASLDEVYEQLDELQGVDRKGLQSLYPVELSQGVDYNPLDAEFLDRIQDSALAMNDEELDVFRQNGFAISKRQQFATVFMGYASIYSEDLPVYISADAILDAVHRSYDAILMAIEEGELIDELDSLLSDLDSALGAATASEEALADATLYLAVARSLLAGAAGSDLDSEGQALYSKATEASGIETLSLFGSERLVDFSQFAPRGHYANTSSLQNYFRAMMWLGRIDFRVIETLSDGAEVVRREQFEAMLALAQGLSGDLLDRWRRIDSVLEAFVGPSDNLTPLQTADVIDAFGGLDQALAADDETVMEVFEAGGFGAQRILSHLMVNDGTVATLPLNRSFLLFGQRYVPDSEVLSSVVYDRLQSPRMMPDPLDVAFAALGNNQALDFETADLRDYADFPEALGRARVLMDGQGDEFWHANLYGLWVSALRELSPAASSDDPKNEGLPSIATSEAWGRRILNAQLGSWAELRHDTLLYAKQSYTGIPSCEFPDAYVDPYPKFFETLLEYAEKGATLVDELGVQSLPSNSASSTIGSYFENLRTAASILMQMAENQRAGTEHSQEQLAFVNNAVRLESQSVGCASIDVPDGWYASLFFDRDKAIEYDPTIADVHTQPADEFGALVGNVLHVATGYPRLMVVSVDTCAGPRAYAGVVFAYHERIEGDFTRLSDQSWASLLDSGDPQPDVGWMQALLP